MASEEGEHQEPVFWKPSEESESQESAAKASQMRAENRQP